MATAIIGSLLVLATAGAAAKIVKDKKSGRGVCSSCSSCAARCLCGSTDAGCENTGLSGVFRPDGSACRKPADNDGEADA